MADWILVACLRQLFTEFNRIAPGRDKASDGSIGDIAHQNSTSDHNRDEEGSVPIHDADSTNEVHAIDVDNDLREPGLSMERVVQFLLARCRSGAERRLRYIIYNRRIWSASSDWVQKPYSGSNPHDHHAHFSASHTTSLEASTASWHLEDLVALSDEDKTWFKTQLRFATMSDTGRTLGGNSNNAVDATLRVEDKVDALMPVVAGIAQQQSVNTSALQAKIEQVDEEVLKRLADAGRSDEDIAASLRSALTAALGAERAGEVIELLADL